jgi:hypothetical protein
VLVPALGATLVGFILLVAALVSGVFWLAIACIVVCVIGVGFLLADLLGVGRKSEPETAVDPGAGSGQPSEADHDTDGSHRDQSDDEGQSAAGRSGYEQSGAVHPQDEQSGSDDHGVSRERYDDDPPTEEFPVDKSR